MILGGKMPNPRTYKRSKRSLKEGSKLKTSRKKVSFRGTKIVKVPADVSFKTRNGRITKFSAHKKIPVKKKNSFYTKK